LMVLMKMIIGF